MLIMFSWGLLQAQGERHFVTYIGPEIQELRPDRDTIDLKFVIERPYHIQSDVPEQETFIPTEITWEKDNPVLSEIGSAIYPEGHIFRIDTQVTRVFSDTLLVRFPISTELLDKEAAIRGKLRYQACNSAKCFFPRDLDFFVQLMPGEQKD